MEHQCETNAQHYYEKEKKERKIDVATFEITNMLNQVAFISKQL